MRLNPRLLARTGNLRGYLAGTAALGLLTGLLAVAQAYGVSRIIAAAFLDGAGLEALGGPLAALLAVILGRAALLWIGEVTAARAAGRAKRNLREPLLAHLFALGPRYVAGERSGELTATAVEGVEALDAYFSQYLPQLFLTALVPLVVVVAVFSADLLSGLVLLITAPLLPLFMILVGRLAEAQTARRWRTLGLLSAHFLDVLQGLTTLKLLGRSRRQTEIVARISAQFRDNTLAVLRVAFLSALVLEIGATISTAIIAVEVGLRLLYGGIPFQPALFVLLLAPEFYLPFRALGARFHAAMGGGAAAERILGILEQPVPPRAPAGPPPRVGSAIRFEDVSYAYAAQGEAPRPALHGVSFTLEPGQRLALVGPSGAGKTTIAHLLLRFVEPSSGLITVGGVPLDHGAAEAWRAQVAWVPSRPYLFHGTVAGNIRLAWPDAPQEEVICAARAAQADEFIMRLPQGYDTFIGERGARLSAGQAQRLALARAFLKNAPLLILDEATAYLDPADEARVVAAMERLMQGRTVLLIAHRLGTVRRADRVVVLDGGRVVQVGDHATLLAQTGLYARLVHAYSGEALA